MELTRHSRKCLQQFLNELVHVINVRVMASVVAGPSEPTKVVHDGSIEREIDPEEVRC